MYECDINLFQKLFYFYRGINKFLRSMEQVGLTLEDLAKIGDDFYAMHNMFGGMVRDPPIGLSFFLSYL